MDFTLLFCALVLLAVGCFTIYGALQQAGGQFQQYARHWSAVLAGLLACFLLTIMDYRALGRWAWLFYLASAILLVLVLAAGRTVNNAKSWLPVYGFTLQPAEFAKPATLFMLAWIASRPALRLSRFLNLIPFCLLLALPILLVGLQPDWGTALVFIGMAAVLIVVAGVRWRLIVAAGLLAALLAPLSYQYVLAPHQRDRIRTFLRPSEDISDKGWNAHQSMLAVGSGGIAGKGFMKGTQHILGFLPRTVAPSDFIFSVIAEENGFIGSALVVATFLLLTLRCLRIAALSADEFGSYLAVGVAAMFLVHIYINVGMNIHAAPIIGIPLPLVSYGGSFMISCLISIGLVQAVYIRRRPLEE